MTGCLVSKSIHIPVPHTSVTLSCTNTTHKHLIPSRTGVNSFKMFQAYRDVFMIRDDEVCLLPSAA